MMRTRITSWFHANAPSRESLENSQILKPVAHRVLAPELWRFTRRSVPRGVALGLIVGIFLMIPGIQMAGAALMAALFASGGAAALAVAGYATSAISVVQSCR